MQPQPPLPPLAELLAPAGNWDCARAAVENGADAIYFGLEKFNARMRAHNFTTQDLPELMRYLHSRGVKGYVTFNTLVFTDELADAAALLETVIEAGVDAAIVQDPGICSLIRQLSPDFPIHASTQMTITSVAGVEFAKHLGCDLVVLARECSIKEIEAIHRDCVTATADGGKLADPEVLLEAFVHGALCVAYSGQCLTSESLGGRSANRGECAQACRLPYELISDGLPVALGDRRYLLSPQDLAGLEVLPQLMQAGVRSFKIEGRLKTPEYVANITQAYRQVIDKTVTGSASPAPSLDPRMKKDLRYNIEMAFSRGLHTGWLLGTDNQALVHARFGKKRGVYLGNVSRITGTEVFASLKEPLKPGDGVVFDCGDPASEEEGGRVHFADPVGKETRIKFGTGDVNLRRVRAGDRIWKTSDPELDRRLRKTFSKDTPQFRRPVAVLVSGKLGTPLYLTMIDHRQLAVHAASRTVLRRAETHSLDETILQDHLGRMGNTPFKLERLEANLDSGLMLPVSDLNQLRRDACDLMLASRAALKPWKKLTAKMGVRLAPEKSASAEMRTAKPPQAPVLIPLVRSMQQLDAVLELGHALIYCELEDPKRYREAVRLYRQTNSRQPISSPSGSGLFVAPPRIFKPGEEWIMKIVEASDPDGFLVRNHHHLKTLKDCRKIGDFSLNTANPLTAEHYMSRYGLERVAASYDLNASQLGALLQGAPPEWFEITIHQQMPMFHMEHCVFCAFLSSGTNYTNCGRPCEKHSVSLRDRVGIEHPLKADAGCRNTVFNGRPQTGAEHVSSLVALGARWFRVEFVNERPDAVKKCLRLYADLLEGRVSGRELWRELRLRHQLGVTRGPREPSEESG